VQKYRVRARRNACMEMSVCIEIHVFLAILDMKHVFSVFRVLLKNTYNRLFVNVLRGIFEEKCGAKKRIFARFCARGRVK